MIKNEFTTKSDVYSFGMIVFEILSNEIPFNEITNENQLINLVVHNEKRPNINEKVPIKYKELIVKCWSQNPDERPSFDQIFHQLKFDNSFITDNINVDDFNRFEDFIEKQLNVEFSQKIIENESDIKNGNDIKDKSDIKNKSDIKDESVLKDESDANDKNKSIIVDISNNQKSYLNNFFSTEKEKIEFKEQFLNESEEEDKSTNSSQNKRKYHEFDSMHVKSFESEQANLLLKIHDPKSDNESIDKQIYLQSDTNILVSLSRKEVTKFH